MANPDLPQEILLEIFSKLPTKSVGKCRTLSKYWKNHLSTNNFIKKHLISRQQRIKQENVALVTKECNVYIITSPTKNDEVFNDECLPGKWLCFIGSCNGLVLLAGNKNLLLVNPITLKQVTIQIQPPHIFKRHQDFGFCDSIACGFGYDSCSDDYKIVRICSFSQKNGDGLAKTFVYVYSVKNGVWKRLDGCYPYGGHVPSRYGFEGGAFVNGALHWLICSKERYRSCIAAFDLANEVFCEIPLPKEFVRQLGNDVDRLVRFGRRNGVSVVGGCLSIVDDLGNEVTDVWILKRYGVAESWVRFRIEDEDNKWHSIVATLCYVEDGELLCLTSWASLLAFDLKGGTMKEIVLGGRYGSFSHGMAFVDSLVSPEGSP